ncbi:hypothetical protein BCR39DRAFT_509129 [Naematelia encephala]|uniref:Uncharacterized protein n=1 Tax=Naematelia encephala TaxID=71784 RepID=A0A1Y2BKS1_9TREE|nr:hypothetical protein BCR39DRAFT_509129 [Naematelia encephala]
MLVHVLQIVLLTLPIALAVPTTAERDVSLSSLVGDLVCPKGQTLFQVFNDVVVPNTPPAKVWSYLGNFCDVSWQDFDLISTTGQCNAHESTRTVSTLGLSLTEQLVLNTGSASSPAPWQTLFVQAFELVGNPQVAGASFTNVHDLIKVSKVGTATEVHWEVIGCSNNTAIAQSIFSQVHGGALAGTVTHFT